MIKKKSFHIGILGAIIFSCLVIPYSLKETRFLSSPENNLKSSSFFVAIPVARFSSKETPCFDVEIDGEKFSALFDLGYTRYISAKSEIIEKIANKTFLQVVASWGIKGKKYESKLYKITKVYIGNIVVSHVALEEEVEAMNQESVIVEAKDLKQRISYEGKLGWRLFKNMTLFLDFDNEKIILADSLETFKKQGPSLTKFIKVPMLLERGLIEFDTMTPKGPLRCFLDTGCTSNHYHTLNRDNETLEQLYFNQKKILEFSTFQIGGRDLGKVIFRPIPFKLPIRIQGVLGMDFLFDHQVFIDFKNQNIYFRCNPE